MTSATTFTDDGAGWLKVEFGKTHFVHKVKIYYCFYTNWFKPDDWCIMTVPNFRYCVDKHNNVDVSVYQEDVKQKSCGTLQLTYGLEQSDQIYTFVCNIGGDSVKLSKENGHLLVSEIVLVGKSKC